MTSALESKLTQVGISILGALLTALETAIIFIIPAIILTVADVYSAHCLGKRVARKYPHHADGKFKSDHKNSILKTIIIACLALIVASYVDQLALRSVGSDYAVRFTFCFFCFYQVWSIAENWSSENPNNKIALACQRIMVNKAERHLNVPLADILLNDKKEGNGKCDENGSATPKA